MTTAGALTPRRQPAAVPPAPAARHTQQAGAVRMRQVRVAAEQPAA